MRKSYGTVASIANGTNRIVSSTSCHWLKIEPGALFKFDKDESFSEVANVNNYKYVKNFIVKNRNTIIVESNVFPDLFTGDTIEITYKEYSLDNIKLITSPGHNYKIGEIVYLDGGILVPDNHSVASIKVTGLNDSGGITEYDIISPGRYLKSPEESECNTSSSEEGHGAKLAIEFKELEKRGWTDRTISSIKYLPNQSIISLTNLLPEGVKIGKLSAEKWEITTINDYYFRGKDVCAESYDLSTHMLPNYGLHKLVRGESDPTIVINRNFIKLSEQIKRLEEEISKLKNK